MAVRIVSGADNGSVAPRMPFQGFPGYGVGAGLAQGVSGGMGDLANAINQATMLKYNNQHEMDILEHSQAFQREMTNLQLGEAKTTRGINAMLSLMGLNLDASKFIADLNEKHADRAHSVQLAMLPAVLANTSGIYKGLIESAGKQVDAEMGTKKAAYDSASQIVAGFNAEMTPIFNEWKNHLPSPVGVADSSKGMTYPFGTSGFFDAYNRAFSNTMTKLRGLNLPESEVQGIAANVLNGVKHMPWGDAFRKVAERYSDQLASATPGVGYNIDLSKSFDSGVKTAELVKEGLSRQGAFLKDPATLDQVQTLAGKANNILLDSVEKLMPGLTKQMPRPEVAFDTSTLGKTADALAKMFERDDPALASSIREISNIHANEINQGTLKSEDPNAGFSPGKGFNPLQTDNSNTPLDSGFLDSILKNSTGLDAPGISDFYSNFSPNLTAPTVPAMEPDFAPIIPERSW